MAKRRHRYNPWPGESKAHSAAAHIGWSYRPRRKGPRAPIRYLAAAGLSRAALAKYRKARKTKPAILLSKRSGRKRKTGKPRTAFIQRPFLVNRGRSRRNNGRKNWYSDYVRKFAASHRGLKGPALMRAASQAYRRNPGVAPGAVYFNQALPTVRPLLNRRRRKAGGRKRGRGRSRRNIYTSYGNPVLPYFAFENRRRYGKKRGRYARRNPVLPYAAFNRRKAVADPFAAITTSIETVADPDFWMKTVLPIGGGFIGAQFVGGFVQAGLEKILGPQTGFLGSLQRVGSRALGAAGTSALALLATRSADIGTKVLAGGLVAVLVQIIQEIFGLETYEKITGMAGFIGNTAHQLTNDIKNRIAHSVKAQIAAAESGAAGVGAVNAFVSTQNLQTAPELGPGPRIGDFVQTQGLRTAPVAAGQPMVADLSAYSDGMMDMMLI